MNGCGRARESDVGARAAYDAVRSAGDDVMVPSLASRPRRRRLRPNSGAVRFWSKAALALDLLCALRRERSRIASDPVRPSGPAKRFPRRGPVSKNTTSPQLFLTEMRSIPDEDIVITPPRRSTSFGSSPTGLVFCDANLPFVKPNRAGSKGPLCCRCAD